MKEKMNFSMARALRFGAKEFRDMKKPTHVFMICAVFSHSTDDCSKLLSGEPCIANNFIQMFSVMQKHITDCEAYQTQPVSLPGAGDICS